MAPDVSIFKAYDIRGIVDKTLTEDAVRQIGRVLGTMAHEAGRTSFCVGRDGRLSGERLAGALMDTRYLMPVPTIIIIRICRHTHINNKAYQQT